LRENDVEDYLSQDLAETSRKKLEEHLDSCAKCRELVSQTASTAGLGPGQAEQKSEEQSDLSGTRLSHYLIQEKLGAGGMGEVYRADDLALGRPVAIKVLHPKYGGSHESRALREARVFAKLQHPGIATFYESGRANGTAFIAMELVDGITLRARLRKGPLPAASAVALADTLLESLAHAHDA